jgi:hypothetical protein
VTKERALAGDHLADSCGDRSSIHLFRAARIVADREIVFAHRDARADAAVSRCKNAPGLI